MVLTRPREHVPAQDAVAYIREQYSRHAVETPWQRRSVARFRSSMNSASHAMGLHMQNLNLNLQLQRLEADKGTQLLHRAPHRYAPMVPTQHGWRLLKHLTRSWRSTKVVVGSAAGSENI